MGPPGHVFGVGDLWTCFFFGFGDVWVETLVVCVGRHPATRGLRHPAALAVGLAVGVQPPALVFQTWGL